MKALGLVLALAFAAGAVWWFVAGGGPEAPARTSLDALLERAQGLYDRNDHDASAALYARAADEAEAQGDLLQAVALRAQSGVCLKMAGRTSEARVLLEPALEAARASGDRRTEGLALGNLAKVEALEANDELALRYLDELARLAVDVGDPRLQVQTLEQASMLALDLGDPEGALARIDVALEANRDNAAEDDRRDALLRQRALIMARDQDDEGALTVWASAAMAPVSLANQALHRSELGLHGQAADLAREAAHLFEQEGAARQVERDEAWQLYLGECLRAERWPEVRQQLDLVLGSGSDELALAPYRILAARLALAEGRSADAAEQLGAARAALGGDGRGEQASWLHAVALGLEGRRDDARAVLAELGPSLASTRVLGWLLSENPPRDRLALDLMPGLVPGTTPGGDRSLATLDATCPVRLPSLPWLALHHGLADAGRLRESGSADVAEQTVRRAVAASLAWQFLEARRRLTGHWPDQAGLDGVWSTIDGLVDGSGLGDDQAFVAVLTDDLLSYLVLCTSSLGATTFGLPRERDLLAQAGKVTSALKAGSRDDVAQQAERLFSMLFEKRAQIDLRNRGSWTLLLPDGLSSVPPAMWVTDSLLPGRPISWLVRDRTPELVPHVMSAAVAPATDRVGWSQVGRPATAPGASVAMVPGMITAFGEGVLDPGPPRSLASASAPLTGAAATVGGLAEVAQRCQVLEASVPGAGGGRLGGLLLAPDEGALRGDARAGLLPWHRLARLDLPPVVILDRTRFDPDDPSRGMSNAAAAAVAGGARWVVLSRWPIPASVRDRLVSMIELGVPEGIGPGEALAAGQRTWLAGAERSGRSELEHPRMWAGLCVWGQP